MRLEFLINQVRVFLDKGHYKAAIKELRALRNSFSTRPSLFSKAQPQLDSLIEKVRALNQLATAAQRAARAAREVAEAARAAAPIARAAANAAKPVLDKVAAVPPPAKLVLLVGATLLALGGAAGEAWAMTKD